MKRLFILAMVAMALILTTTLATPQTQSPPRFAQFPRLFTETVNGRLEFSNELKEDLCTFPIQTGGNYTFDGYKGDDWTGVSIDRGEYYEYTLSFCAVSTETECSAQNGSLCQYKPSEGNQFIASLASFNSTPAPTLSYIDPAQGVDAGLKLIFSGSGSPCQSSPLVIGHRTTTINITCDLTAQERKFTVFEYETCFYEVNLKTPAVCCLNCQTDCDPTHSKCLNGGYISFDRMNQWCNPQCTCPNNWQNSKENLAYIFKNSTTIDTSENSTHKSGCDECSLPCSNHLISHNRLPTGKADPTCQTCICEKGYSGPICNCKELFFSLSFSSFPSEFKSPNLHAAQSSTRLESLNEFRAQLLYLNQIESYLRTVLESSEVKVVYWKLITEKNHTLLTLTVNIPAYCSTNLQVMDLENFSSLSTQPTDHIYDSLQRFINDINNTKGFGVQNFLPQIPVQLSKSIYNPSCAPNDFSIGSKYDCNTARGISPFPNEFTVKKSNSNNIELIIPIIILSVLVGVLIGYIIFSKVYTSSQESSGKKSEKIEAEAEAATTTDQPTPTDLVETDSTAVKSTQVDDETPQEGEKSNSSPESDPTVESIQVITETGSVESTAV
jgi:hypothetical protein